MLNIQEKDFVQERNIQHINQTASRGLVIAVADDGKTLASSMQRWSGLEIRDEGSASLMGLGRRVGWVTTTSEIGSCWRR